MADKLAVWKQALIHLGKATITTLTDDVEARYVFDGAWPGVVAEAFNAGDWNFAKKSVSLSASGSGTAAPGWTYVWDYPDDYERTIVVSSIADFHTPFYEFLDEGGFLHTNTLPIYLRYISDAKQADDQIPTWPTMFWRLVAMKLAHETAERITGSSTKKQELERELGIALRKAKSVDARNENNKRIATGSWLRSRLGGYGQLGDNRGGTLVGGEITFDEGDV